MNEQTLQQLLAERVSACAASDKPRELIDAGIHDMFKNVVTELFRSYGDTSKSIKEAVAAALPANIGDMFELQRYNALIINSLRQRWEDEALKSSLIEQADKAMNEIFMGDGLLTGEVSLRELLKAFIEEHRERAREENWERPEIRIEENDMASMKFMMISFDPEPESSYSGSSFRSDRRSDYSLKHRLHVSVLETRETERFHSRENIEVCDVMSATVDDQKVAINMRINSKWERMVASLYFGNAKLLVDCCPDDFSYNLDD